MGQSLSRSWRLATRRGLPVSELEVGRGMSELWAAKYLAPLRRCRGVAALRKARRQLSTQLKEAPTRKVLAIGADLIASGYEWVGFEIIAARADVLARMTPKKVESLGDGLTDWGRIDAYGVLLAGPAWRAGALTDVDILRWARSSNLWRRRAALVATVPWNTKSRGGAGDARRTLLICQALVDDRQEMVVKAMSWALRALVPWDREAVERFLLKHDLKLAARVKREVRNKLSTGRKSGRTKQPPKS